MRGPACVNEAPDVNLVADFVECLLLEVSLPERILHPSGVLAAAAEPACSLCHQVRRIRVYNRLSRVYDALELVAFLFLVHLFDSVPLFDELSHEGVLIREFSEATAGQCDK